MTTARCIAIAAGTALLLCSAAAQEKDKKPEPKAEQFTYRVYGLFVPDREKDLRENFKEIAGVTLVSVSFDAAEVTVEFVPSKVFPGAKPEQVVERLDQKVRAESHSTFGVGPRLAGPRDKFERVVIAVGGLDCRACELAAYEGIARLDGVAQATASFKDGKVTALIDPAKTDRAKLEDALRKRGVQIPKQ
ncbi:copper-exporting p-type atpase a : : HMA [Gemmataceae bacterium]|nr:copper-exporting p-type atpase a : : HMA [Gemmataceae bacterium]VTT98285.1 copper-exporting p-type atpase a : : HMA [Gemmataceae bacterium]